jgi:hypothetical protein
VEFGDFLQKWIQRSVVICRCSHLILLGDDMRLRVSTGAELRGFWLSECLSLCYLCFLIF